MNRWLKALTAALLFGVLAACGGDDDPAPATTTPPAVTVPAVPSSLSVEPGDQVNTVQWSAVPGATSYTLYWSETSPVAKATATAIPNAVSPFKHTGLTNGKLIYYAVAALNAGGESELSSVIGAMPVAPVPAAPVAVNASSGDASVALTWSPVSGADSYSIYWSKAAGVVPGAAGVTKIPSVAATSYTHTGLTNGDRYYYIVTAVNTGGESVASSEASATPMPPAPGAPANVAATGGDTQVQLSWSPVTDATSYSVYWAKVAGVVPGGAGVTKITSATTSYTHTGLTNGDTYYYVITATGMAGEGAASAEKSARPLPPPPPAPLGITAIAPKDAIEVTVQWFDVPNYPSSTAPIQLGYNLYRGLQPGVATYFQDATRATKFANVTAPYIDTTVTKGTTYYYVVTAFVPAIPDVQSVPSGEVTAAVGTAGGGGGGEEPTEGFGNNLAVPLIFADSYGLTGAKITGTWPGIGPFATLPTFDVNTGLRPLSTETLTTFPNFDTSTAVAIAGVTYYPQKTASTWQAEWRAYSGATPLEVIVDWGDALTSRSYTESSVIRVETALLQDATIAGVTDTMTAYKMVLLSGSGATELRGTDASTYSSAVRNVFVVNARLTIEKISTDGSPDVLIFNRAIYESLGAADEGRVTDKYTAELNVAGSIVYGYNFFLNSVTGLPSKKGDYRITFSLDPTAKVGGVDVPNHVQMVKASDAKATLSSNGLSTSIIVTVN